MKRMRQRLAFGLGVGVLAVALAGVVVVLRLEPLPSRYERIQEGMTRQEVEAIEGPFRGQEVEGFHAKCGPTKTPLPRWNLPRPTGGCSPKSSKRASAVSPAPWTKLRRLRRLGF